MGMKKLLTKQKPNQGNITALETQMVSITKTKLKEIERLQKDIVENNKRLKCLTQCVMHMQVIIDKFIWKVNNNANAFRFLAFIWKNISQYGKKFVKIPAIVGRFRPLNG